MSRNGDIRGFFGNPPARANSQSKQGTSSPSQIQSMPDLPLSSSFLSSPKTPPKPTPARRDRTDVIKGSDEDDGDSDSSLESISAFIKPKRGPAPYQRDPNLTSTPKAKRIASTSVANLKSPLTIQTKHKYDMKSLLSQARQSDQVDESARRADELINQSEDEDSDDDGRILSEVQKDPNLLQKTAKELLDNNEEDAKGDKLMRAMNRTKVDGSRRRQCYFFNLEKPLFKPVRKPFPEKKAKGCWRCLANSRTRDQAVIHGLPHTIISKGKSLPDELFLWILDEICVERNAQLRVQYGNLVALCPDSITRLVTDVRLYSMLEKLGGPKYPRSQDGTKLQSSPRVENPYPQRDWTGLVTFLELLERMAPSLSPENVMGAIKLLLRMGFDSAACTIVRAEHVAAMEALVKTLPKAGTRQWDEACETISSYVYESVDEPMHQVLPISHMPRTSAKLLDLWRRMSAVALFRDIALSRRPVDESITLNDILHRLDSPDFRVGANTDFQRLGALVTLLDTAIGNAKFLTQEHSGAVNADRKFDADIDDLAFRLKIIHDKIYQGTSLTRKTIKLNIDLIAKRLTYMVRTRPPPKTDHYDVKPVSKDDFNVPKQRDFMKNWTQKKAERKGAAAVLANGNGDVDAGIK
ncbi:hypothetical protein F5Y04DRAFT_269435 [Hypomontagnella monticulosa]|nr:hypothetical protein F5Y04DRAFT_269435 [Hypomontagnella monticulosa]